MRDSVQVPVGVLEKLLDRCGLEYSSGVYSPNEPKVSHWYCRSCWHTSKTCYPFEHREGCPVPVVKVILERANEQADAGEGREG